MTTTNIDRHLDAYQEVGVPVPFQWTTQETFEVVNVLSSTEERDANARWLVETFLYAEDYLRELLADVPLAEPIDLDKVDWDQVYEAFLEEPA